MGGLERPGGGINRVVSAQGGGRIVPSFRFVRHGTDGLDGDSPFRESKVSRANANGQRSLRRPRSNQWGSAVEKAVPTCA